MGALPIVREKRRSERLRLKGLMPGKIVNQKGESISCRPIDISERGLGMITQGELKMGELLTLTVGGTELFLKVTWVNPGFGKLNEKRYGLEAVENHVNLVEVFQDYLET